MAVSSPISGFVLMHIVYRELVVVIDFIFQSQAEADDLERLIIERLNVGEWLDRQAQRMVGHLQQHTQLIVAFAKQGVRFWSISSDSAWT